MRKNIYTAGYKAPHLRRLFFFFWRMKWAFDQVNVVNNIAKRKVASMTNFKAAFA